ncbi:hypothetical protein AURDEDRAFT_127191 [Auricularia subglabra TFB-10046 SS5]|nr:hypothetical protein AURDEDRAFT_127191 [Auricularia subglabra TFB-10046 SS5]
MSSDVSSEGAHARALLSTAAKPARDGISAPAGFHTSTRDHHLQTSGHSPKDESSPKMSGVAFTIGSFGDFSTLLQMTFAIRRAVIEAKGGSDDIKSTIAAIDSFVLAIQGVREQLERADSIPVSVQNGIQHALGVCTQALQRVQGRIESYRRRYEKTNGSRGWRNYWALCLWTILGGKAEVAGLMQHLANQVSVLQTFVSLIQCTSLENIESRQDAQGGSVSQILSLVTSLSSRVQSDVPFTFFDYTGCAINPMLRMSWGNFVDFWEEHDFPHKVEDISRNELHQAEFSIVNVNGSAWFDLYIYEDPQSFGTPTALISPIYFYEAEGDPPRLSRQLSRLFVSSAKWLEKTLEHPESPIAPLVGLRSRQQFIFLETGYGNDIHGSLHTRQYFLDVAPGPQQPEGRFSPLFEYLKSEGRLRRKRAKDPDMQDVTVTSRTETHVQVVEEHRTDIANTEVSAAGASKKQV